MDYVLSDLVWLLVPSFNSSSGFQVLFSVILDVGTFTLFGGYNYVLIKLLLGTVSIFICMVSLSYVMLTRHVWDVWLGIN